MEGEDAAGLQAPQKLTSLRALKKLLIQIEPNGESIKIKGTQIGFTKDGWGLARFFKKADTPEPKMVEIIWTGFMLDKRPNCLDHLLLEVSVLTPSTSHLRVLVPSHVKSLDDTMRILRTRLFDPFKTSSQPIMLKATQQSVIVNVEMKKGCGLHSVEVMPYKVANDRDQAGNRKAYLQDRMIQDLLDHIPFHTAHMHLLAVLLREDTLKALCTAKSLKVLRLWAWERKQLTSIDFKMTDRLAKALETCTKKTHSEQVRSLALRNNRGAPKRHKPNTEVGTLSQLESLVFEDITFSRKHFLTICKSLEKNQTIKHLAVKDCCLHPGFLDESQGWTPLLNMIRRNNVLKTIKLDFWNHKGQEVQSLEYTDKIKRTLCAILKTKRRRKHHSLTALSIHSKPHRDRGPLADKELDVQMQLDANFFSSTSLMSITDDAFTEDHFYRGLLEMAEDADYFSDRTAFVNRLYTLVRRKPDILPNVLPVLFKENS